VPWPEWIRDVEVEPSLYGADFSRLGEQTEALLEAGARIFHYDIGDGHFVEPITIGPIVLQSISPLIHRGGGRIDVHMMVDQPAKHFAAVAAAGGDSVTFHVEAVGDVLATVGAAREHGLEVGVAFNPETDPETVAEYGEAVDLVLCMSINPGYSGQPFQEATYDRVRRLRAALPDAVLIQVDGGVNAQNIGPLHDAGARLLVAASSIFGDEEPPSAYRRLLQHVQ
jgi:ribulose-phosphate 3-epimerase